MKLKSMGIIGAMEERTTTYDGKTQEFIQVALIVGTEAVTCKTENKEFLGAPLYKPVELTFSYNSKFGSLKLDSFVDIAQSLPSKKGE